MKRAVVISGVVHAVVAVGLWWAVTSDDAGQTATDDSVSIEILEPNPNVNVSVNVDVNVNGHRAPDGAPAPSPSPTRAATTVTSMVDIVALPGQSNGHGDSDRDGDSDGDSGGPAGGLAARMAAAPIPAPPAPPAAADHPARVSKARPARLVYPSRDSDTDADRLFVAVVTVDSDGFVVGAHLTATGTPGPLRDDAAGLIFKFRYAPALDDDGRPVRSTFEQPFQLAR